MLMPENAGSFPEIIALFGQTKGLSHFRKFSLKTEISYS